MAQRCGADEPSSKRALSILEVAERLFSETGFDAVSINDIARGAGVSKANVFHHFGSKEGLYMTVLKHACRRSAQALDAPAEDLAAPPEQRLRGFFVRHLEALFAHPLATRLMQRELLEHGSQRGRRLAEEVFAEDFSRLVDLVRAGQRQGALRADLDAALLAFLLVGANVFFFETRPILEHLPEAGFATSPEGYANAVFELLADGFSASTHTDESP